MCVVHGCQEWPYWTVGVALGAFLEAVFPGFPQTHPFPLTLMLAVTPLYLLRLCCIGSDCLQKTGLQPHHLTFGLQGQYQACSWWRERKYGTPAIGQTPQTPVRD